MQLPGLGLLTKLLWVTWVMIQWHSSSRLSKSQSNLCLLSLLWVRIGLDLVMQNCRDLQLSAGKGTTAFSSCIHLLSCSVCVCVCLSNSLQWPHPMHTILGISVIDQQVDWYGHPIACRDWICACTCACCAGQKFLAMQSMLIVCGGGPIELSNRRTANQHSQFALAATSNLLCSKLNIDSSWILRLEIWAFEIVMSKQNQWRQSSQRVIDSDQWCQMSPRIQLCCFDFVVFETLLCPMTPMTHDSNSNEVFHSFSLQVALCQCSLSGFRHGLKFEVWSLMDGNWQ